MVEKIEVDMYKEIEKEWKDLDVDGVGYLS